MSALWPAIWLTLKVALTATAINVVAGVLLARWISRARGAWREAVDALLTLPMVLPPTVIGYYLLVLFGSQGLLGQWLAGLGIRLVFTWQGAVLAASVVALPLVYKSARTAFEQVDGQLEQMARSLGLSETALFFRVSLPLATRGIVAGTLLAFARATGEFGATLMIAGSIPGQTQTLSLAIYEAVQAGRDADALTLVLITSLMCMAVLLTVSRLQRSAA
ncbi:molybdate ABC transporter permease subunit [Chitinibacteraceae bacterium HSL-7]